MFHDEYKYILRLAIPCFYSQSIHIQEVSPLVHLSANKADSIICKKTTFDVKTKQTQHIC